MKHVCITFAGPIGSSKSPIAHHIGWNLGVPLFNTDILRTETIEDRGAFDQAYFEELRDKRLARLINSHQSFICDASMDRKWAEFKSILIKNNYRWFIISLDLSKDFLVHLYNTKGYYESLQQIDTNYEEHKAFLSEFGNEVNITITDQTFESRLSIALDAVQEWLVTNQSI